MDIADRGSEWRVLRIFIVMVLVYMPSQSQAATVTYTVLHRFSFLNNFTDGLSPQTGLVQDKNGILYGTTSLGGSTLSRSGTIFQITTSGTFTKLADQRVAAPISSIIIGQDNQLYGLNPDFFRLTPTGSLEILFRFSSFQPPSPQIRRDLHPASGLITGNDGAFYGSGRTFLSLNGFPAGVIYRLTQQGTFSLVYPTPEAFSQNLALHGELVINSSNTLLQDSDGTFYGQGVFVLPPNEFPKYLLRNIPPSLRVIAFSSIMMASDGNLYLTGSYNINTAAVSAIFRLTPNDTLTVLHSFDFATEGVSGIVPLVEGSDGNLYGSGSSGGPKSTGTIYRISLSGELTVLYVPSTDDGVFLAGPMLQSQDGSFYGATRNGGNTEVQCVFGCGAIFKLDVGLSSQALKIQITLENPQPGQTDPLVGQKVIFTPIGNPVGATNWIWDFGDGSEPLLMDTDDPVEHIYTEGETFTVALDVHNGSVVASAVDPSASATKEVMVLCSLDPNLEAEVKDKKDCDDDALPNEWEIHGVDTDGDGTRDLNLKVMGADPLKKDVFVWIDWLSGHDPNPDALEMVRKAFAARDITLHTVLRNTIPVTAENMILLDCIPPEPQSTCPPVTCISESASDLNSIKAFYFLEENRKPGRANVFRYALYAHFIGREADNTTTNVYGRSPTGSSDFVLAHELIANGQNYGINKIRNPTVSEAGIFMHELGHTLGLDHNGLSEAGRSEVNFKPNHLSVMNYSFTLNGLRVDGALEKLDYSIFDISSIPDLVEDGGLNETKGLNGTSEANRYGTIWYCGSKRINNQLEPQEIFHSNDPADWNCKDGIEDVNVTANVNADSVDPSACGTPEKYSTLHTSLNEWNNILYKYGSIGGSFADVVSYPATIPYEEDLPSDKLADGCFTSGDCDGDGIPDTKDVCSRSRTESTVVLEQCNTLSSNKLLSNGCTIADRMARCVVSSDNHSQFVSCVAQLTNDLKQNGTISDIDKGKIQTCAAAANYHKDLPGDLDGDGDVDQNDINILLADRNKLVSQSACGAQCDFDGDDKITALDARKLTLLCTRPRCATQ